MGGDKEVMLQLIEKGDSRECGSGSGAQGVKGVHTFLAGLRALGALLGLGSAPSSASAWRYR